MRFEKGHKKLGGRKKGTINKRTRVEEVCQEAGIDPFAILAEIASSAKEETTRLAAAKELARYLEPQLKAIEIASPEKSHESAPEIKVIVCDYTTESWNYPRLNGPVSCL
jgi:hypothetical protein